MLRRIELVDEEALTYGILVVKCDDHLMAKKYGHRTTPALVFFRHGKLTHFEGLKNCRSKTKKYAPAWGFNKSGNQKRSLE